MRFDTLGHIPHQPGVYFFKDKDGEILYIGKAKDLQKRIGQYFSPNSVWKQEMIEKAESLDFLVVKTESEALYLENNLIKKHNPSYNNMLKGANGYAYIKITKHSFPQVLLTRTKKHDGAVYIGPKHATRELKKFLQYMRQLLQYRACTNTQFSQKKVCSDFYFHLCKGWCEGCPGMQFSKSLNEEYRDLMQLVISFFRGNTKPIEKEIASQIALAVEQQNFEWAAKLRDIYYQIGFFVEKQDVELPKDISGYVIKIKKIGFWNVYVFLHFFEGKLIDVVRHKLPQGETDFSSMLASFEAEFGTFIVDEEMFPLDEQEELFLLQKGMKFSQTEKKALLLLIDNFFDSYVIASSFEGETLHNDLLQTLQERYGFKNFPYRMECVDISHLSGAWISGAVSCLVGGIPEKKYYRRYKIQTVKGQSDDYASLLEVLKRRFHLGEKRDEKSDFSLPDVFILDGGKGQLGVVKNLYDESDEFKVIYTTVQFVALGKGEARKRSRIGSSSKKQDLVSEKIYYYDTDFSLLETPLVYDQADRFLIKVRDEAHRFSNQYRKKQMEKELKK